MPQGYQGLGQGRAAVSGTAYGALRSPFRIFLSPYISDTRNAAA